MNVNPHDKFYGSGGTIHQNDNLDIGVDATGRVVSVWFRCLQLPFEQYLAFHDPLDTDISITGVTYRDRVSDHDALISRANEWLDSEPAKTTADAIIRELLDALNARVQTERT